jgi:hypothetical protein
MKLVIAHSQLTTYGGGERSTLELLRHLGRRHEVELWTSRYRPEATYPELAEFPRRTRTVLWGVSGGPATAAHDLLSAHSSLQIPGGDSSFQRVRWREE